MRREGGEVGGRDERYMQRERWVERVIKSFFVLYRGRRNSLVHVAMIPGHVIAHNSHFSVWCTRVTVYMYVEL